MMTYPLGMGSSPDALQQGFKKNTVLSLYPVIQNNKTTDILIVRIQNFHQMLSEIQTFPATQSDHDTYYHFNGTSSLTDN